MRDKIFYTICFGFILGVLLRSFIFVNTFVVILIGVIALAVILYFFISSKREINRKENPLLRKWSIVAGIFILAFSLGVLRFSVAEKNIATALDQWSGNQIIAGESVSLSGMIADELKHQFDIALDKKKILLVDDDSDTRILVRDAILSARQGAKVVVNDLGGAVDGTGGGSGTEGGASASGIPGCSSRGALRCERCRRAGWGVGSGGAALSVRGWSMNGRRRYGIVGWCSRRMAVSSIYTPANPNMSTSSLEALPGIAIGAL